MPTAFDWEILKSKIDENTGSPRYPCKSWMPGALLQNNFQMLPKVSKSVYFCYDERNKTGHLDLVYITTAHAEEGSSVEGGTCYEI